MSGKLPALDAERRIEPLGNLRASWEALFEEARGCTRCDLYKCGTQQVFGEGPLDAIHGKPDAGEIDACRWWLEHERELIRPPVTVALGATAARSLLGKAVTIGRVRGAPIALADGSECWVTVHPSFLLRIPEADRRREERARFVSDLKQVWTRAEELAG